MRYARQSVFSKIGEEGQQQLLKSKVVIIGMGALGTVSANNLCRAGVGHIRMVDRDYVEMTNLQRQILFNESDAKESLPKTIAAFNRLSTVNSEIILEPIVSDVNSANIESLVRDADLILDATDNFEIRFLINEAAIKYNIPWIYGAALGSQGMTFNILKGGPCLLCFMGDSGESAHTCGTFGVINTVTSIVASIQSTEALKILLKSDDIRKEMLVMDVWENSFNMTALLKDEDCPVCVHGKYSRLNSGAGAYTSSICGTDSVQVVPLKSACVDFTVLAKKLKKIGNVRHNKHTLTFSDKKYEFVLFKDGRAMIKNVIDENNAKSVYTEYIGL